MEAIKKPNIRHVFTDKALRAGVNTTLTQDDIRKVKREVIETILAQLRGRDLLPIEKVDLPNEFYTWYSETRMGAAVVRGRRTTHTMTDDVTEVPATPVPIPYIEKEFQIHRLDAVAKNDAKTRNARSAARRVAEAENDLIYNGCTLPAINGLIAGKGNTSAATANWSAAPGSGDPYEDVNTLIGLMEADGFMGPYKMRVEPTNLAELRKREVKAGGAGVSYLDLIKSSLIADIQADPSIPHGTAVVVQTGKDTAVLAMPEDVTVEFYDMDKNHVIYGKVYERCVPIIFQANGVGTITGA